MLSIVVDKGRRASPVDVAKRHGEGNNVDVHALDWLACQPKPRVWYTDGGVTGQGHATNREYRDTCKTIVNENGIIQCANIQQVCAALRREREDRAGIFVPRDFERGEFEDGREPNQCAECGSHKDDCAICDDCGVHSSDCECCDGCGSTPCEC